MRFLHVWRMCEGAKAGSGCLLTRTVRLERYLLACPFHVARHIKNNTTDEQQMRKESEKGKERKGKERGKERRKGKERKGKDLVLDRRERQRKGKEKN